MRQIRFIFGFGVATGAPNGVKPGTIVARCVFVTLARSTYAIIVGLSEEGVQPTIASGCKCVGELAVGVSTQIEAKLAGGPDKDLRGPGMECDVDLKFDLGDKNQGFEFQKYCVVGREGGVIGRVSFSGHECHVFFQQLEHVFSSRMCLQIHGNPPEV